MKDMFYSVSSFNGDFSNWDVSRVTNMAYMFYSASSFNGDISKWDVSRVTNMAYMFYSASSFNVDISKWDVSRVTTMKQTFAGTSSFAQTLCGAWLTSAADKDGMFDGSSGRLCTTTSTSYSATTTTSTSISKATFMKALTLAVTQNLGIPLNVNVILEVSLTPFFVVVINLVVII